MIFRREQTHLHLCQRTRIKPCHSHEKQLGHIDRKPFTDISTTHAHSKHTRMTRTHAKRTRNAHETSTMTGGATLRSLPVPNPHCSPTNRTDPWATLRPKPTSHCSPPPSSLSPPQPALFADHLHPNPHSSPKFGLYRFFNIFLQNPYLLTWRIWRKKFGLCRFFNIFLQNSYLLTWRIWRILKTPCILLTTHIKQASLAHWRS